MHILGACHGQWPAPGVCVVCLWCVCQTKRSRKQKQKRSCSAPPVSQRSIGYYMSLSALRAHAAAGCARRAARATCRRCHVSASSPPPPAAAATQLDQAAQPLLRWLASCGADVSGVSISNLNGQDGASGWGLVAAKDVAAGDVLVALPQACTLSYDPDTLSPPLRRLVDRVPSELWGARLGLVLLSHRAQGAGSAYAPYVGLLPSRFDGIPVFFSRDGVDALQYPPVSEQVKKRSRFLLSFADGPLADTEAAASVFGGSTVDAAAMGWALAAVSSRAFRLRGPAEPASMLPLIDMCNHSFTPNCEVKPLMRASSGGGRDGKHIVALCAKERMAAGTPLLISYGPLSNDFLLLDYGFIVRDNPHDRCALRFGAGLLELGREVAGLGHVPFGAADARDATPQAGASAGDAIAAAPWQQLVLADLGLVGAHANLEILIGGADAIDSRLLAALRVLYMQDAAQLRHIPQTQRAASLQSRDASGVVSSQVERCALATAAAVCAVTLSQWPTTLAQDDALLASPDGAALPADVRLAMQFRAEKKRCLSTALSRLKARVEALVSATETQTPAALAAASKKSKGFGGRAAA